MVIERVLIDEAAKNLIDQLRSQHGNLMFHQSGGCCDGSQPMCFTIDEFILGPNDVKLGEIHGCPFYMAQDQFEYWKHTQLTVGVTKGRGSSFSLEIPLGYRFIIHSKIFTTEELSLLSPIK